ncbi:Uncharacterised protein [Escherichia coli]|nr:Uncharacterised protein [Escherichia coli]
MRRSGAAEAQRQSLMILQWLPLSDSTEIAGRAEADADRKHPT